MQLVKARTKLQQTCLKLLQHARERIAAEASGKAAKLERGLAPGSFMQHMANAKHHAGVKNGSPFTDTEIVQQVRYNLPHQMGQIWSLNKNGRVQCVSNFFEEVCACCRHLDSSWQATRPQPLHWHSPFTTCLQILTRQRG